MAKICALCISKEKGTAKHTKNTVNIVKGFGVENDAHGGNWHRQVSLLSKDSVREFENKTNGKRIPEGAFGENILISGINLQKLPIGTILKSGKVRLRITQIGKECHKGCSIKNTVGDCIMPREGVFSIVENGGTVSVGDEIEIESYPPYTLGIITVSDKGYIGQRVDESGDEIERIFKEKGFEV